MLKHLSLQIIQNGKIMNHKFMNVFPDDKKGQKVVE